MKKSIPYVVVASITFVLALVVVLMNSDDSEQLATADIDTTTESSDAGSDSQAPGQSGSTLGSLDRTSTSIVANTTVEPETTNQAAATIAELTGETLPQAPVAPATPAAPIAVPAQPIDSDAPQSFEGRQLLWSDEFNYTGAPNPEFWGYEEGNVRNNEAQYYTVDRRENARVEGGNLVIEARKEDYKGSKYTSASVVSVGKYEFLYGRLEFRAKFTTGRGTWPALWTLGTDPGIRTWPLSGEIDVMENVGFAPNTIHQGFHRGEQGGRSNGRNSKVTGINVGEFNTYALEWTPDRLELYVNGKLNGSYAREAGGAAVWPFVDNPNYILMNFAIGGGWGGQQGIDDSSFPHRMEVDYVRVFEQKS